MADDFTNFITVISMIITFSMAVGTFIMAWYTRDTPLIDTPLLLLRY